ncbi:MAG: hypothetical protein QOE44_566 [Solirubrobacteraceae bacterium]|nr:hypothetical protein [Solirubrobacteraceae bacterium]
MPKFCRHGGVIEKCPICRATIQIPSASPAPRTPRAKPGAARPRSATAKSAAARGGVRVRREARATDDGYRCILVPGLRAEVEARSLAAEVAFAAGRLGLLAADPPGLYGEAASEPDPEEATWLVFLIAHLSPLEAGDPFAGIRAARTSWSSGEPPLLDGVELGPRTTVDPTRSTRTVDAYRRWAQTAGSQQAAFTGDAGWTPERRFERVYERLSLPGFGRRGRFDLLATLGHLGLYPLRAPGLLLAENDATGVAAKRVFAIGDRMTLERRASALAGAAGVAAEALDLGLSNWAAGTRITLGVPAETTDPDAEAGMLAALEL